MVFYGLIKQLFFLIAFIALSAMLTVNVNKETDHN